MKNRLPSGKKGRLINLSENERICEILIKNYSPEVIKRDISVINKQISELEAKKEKIVLERLNPSEAKLVELNSKLKTIHKEQKALRLSPSVLARLAKAIRTIKEIEKLVEA